MLLNQQNEHWIRLLKIVSIIQNLVNQGKYIRFINGLLNWDQELFSNPSQSVFLDRLIDVDYLSDEDIDKLRSFVYNQTKCIDLNLWINPFNSFTAMKIDNINLHPGIKSHTLYADLIFNYLKDDINA